MDKQLPQEVVQCFKNARFLHLGTCADNSPHVALMNYLFVPSDHEQKHTSRCEEDCVVMTCSRRSQKFANITINPKVSILVHDWSTRQKATNATDLTALLSSLNAASISKHSVTLEGVAEILSGPGEQYFKQKMLEGVVDDNAKCYIEDPDSAVIAVHFGSARISDSSNNVERWKSDASVAK